MSELKKVVADRAGFCKRVGAVLNACVYRESINEVGPIVLALARRGTDKQLVVVSEDNRAAADFTGKAGKVRLGGIDAHVKLCPLTHRHAEAVRRCLPFTAPVMLGLKKSFGMGDRLGLATPGHVRAIRNRAIRPIFAQQSIREMARTQRTAEEVIDDATWGVLQEGYRDGFGADADHLKNEKDVDICFKAGFIFYTVDPGEYVDSSADGAEMSELREKFDDLAWDELCCTPKESLSRYVDKRVPLPGPEGDFELAITEADLVRAVVKYGPAVAHVVRMYEYVKSTFAGRQFEFEVSVDETATPTTAAEHYYIAAELKRLGVEWVSLAPRSVGDFEKGVDYMGDMARFRTDFGQHVGIARHFGPYKISLHSGSDKFSIYPMVAELAGELVHVKTAGTSYLEALRTVAQTAPEFFREILTFAKQRYPQDRASYHVSADVREIADAGDLTDEELAGVLDHFDTREACHVTYGSVLTAENKQGEYLFRDQFMQILRENEELYYDMLEKHLGKHMDAFG